MSCHMNSRIQTIQVYGHRRMRETNCHVCMCIYFVQMPMIAVLVSCPYSISYLLRSEMTDGRDRHACWVVTRPDGFAAALVVHSGSALWVQSGILGLAGSSHPVYIACSNNSDV